MIVKDETREPCNPRASPGAVKETNPNRRRNRVTPPILSVRQPWAWLLIHGGKDIENRRWSTNYRGTLLIHASKKIDETASEFVPWAEMKTGGIIGQVQLVDVVEQSSSQWFEGPFGWVVKDPKPIEFYPLVGKLGLFYA